MCVLSHVQLFVILWTVARQGLLSMEFSRQEYWSELPLPTPGDLPETQGSNLRLLCLLHWQADSVQFEPPGRPHVSYTSILKNLRKQDSCKLILLVKMS